MPICATPGCDNAVQYCSECDSETRGTPPHGFMTLGTVLGDETILIRIIEVASVCEGERGSLLTFRSGQQVAIREGLREITKAMNVEATD